MEDIREFEDERVLGYRAPVSPYLSVSPYIAHTRTFLRYYPDGTHEFLKELFDEIFHLPEEKRFVHSARIFETRFAEEMEHPFLRYLPVTREWDEILADFHEVFERGQRRTAKRLLGLDDPRSHLVVVTYTELIIRGIDAMREHLDDPLPYLSAVFPLVIRLKKAHGNRDVTDGFIVDAALAEYYLDRALGNQGEGHPSQYDFDLLESDVLSFGVAIAYRETDIEKTAASKILDISEPEFERLLGFYRIADAGEGSI